MNIILVSSFIHYICVGLCTALTSLGVSLGQSLATKASFKALNRQPAAKNDISRTTLLALALIETSGLIGFIGSIFLYLHKTNNIYDALSQIGFTLAIAIPGLVLGIASSLPAKSALLSIARQPFLAKKIMNFMILTQSLIQTPLAFGFIISLLIQNQFNSVNSLDQALALIASGLCIAVGSIGPIIGVGNFAKSACRSVGINKHAYGQLISFTVISQAIIETPVIFSAIISFWLLRFGLKPLTNPIFALVFIAIAFVMAVGTFGPGISSGKTASQACNQIATNLQNYGVLARTSMIAQGIIDTSAIYAFIVAVLLILTVS